jgi:hypothetical protein
MASRDVYTGREIRPYYHGHGNDDYSTRNSFKEVTGTSEEESELEESYTHLCKLRDEVIEMGILPPVKEWNKLNTHIK